MVDWVEIFVSEYGFPGVSNFDCPDCGSKVTPPIGDHTWTCHEAYGGCGSQFKPEKGIQEIENE